MLEGPHDVGSDNQMLALSSICLGWQSLVEAAGFGARSLRRCDGPVDVQWRHLKLALLYFCFCIFIVNISFTGVWRRIVAQH